VSLAGSLRRLASRWARDPLTVFVLIGIMLMAIDWIRNGLPRATMNDPIEISQGRVLQIAQGFQLVTGRMPDAVEIQHLVDDFISEETSYREAMAMGLDADDTIVRRRLRQKLEFLIEDAAVVPDPGDATLTAFLQAHRQRYAEPSRRVIEQRVFSRDQRGSRAAGDARQALTALNTGADAAALGDASMLPARTEPLSRTAMTALFGEAFAGAVFAAGQGTWFGPVSSPFGEHLVRVVDSTSSALLPLERVRERVLADWQEERRSAARDAFQVRLRARQPIRIEWPSLWQDLSPQANPAPRTRSQRGAQVEE